MLMSRENLILALNPGSSSIKLAIYETQGATARRIGRGSIDLRRHAGAAPYLNSLPATDLTAATTPISGAACEASRATVA